MTNGPFDHLHTNVLCTTDTSVHGWRCAGSEYIHQIGAILNCRSSGGECVLQRTPLRPPTVCVFQLMPPSSLLIDDRSSTDDGSGDSTAPPSYVQYTMHMQQQQQQYHTGVTTTTTTMNPVIGQYVSPLTHVPTVGSGVCGYRVNVWVVCVWCVNV